MGLLDRIKDALTQQGASAGSGSKYPYRDNCKNIWKRYVPAYGPSDALQGELLREVEALRYEAQNNGNINWDDDFAYFCDFIASSIREQSSIPDDMKAAVSDAAAKIKACGEYGARFRDGEIPDDDLDADMIACVDDEPYDIIDNAIGLLDQMADGPIPYERDPSIVR